LPKRERHFQTDTVDNFSRKPSFALEEVLKRLPRLIERYERYGFLFCDLEIGGNIICPAMVFAQFDPDNKQLQHFQKLFRLKLHL